MSRLIASTIAILVASAATAETDRYRLSWRADPSTTMVIGWDQVSENDPVVHWDTQDHGVNWALYLNAEPPNHSVDEGGMDNRFLRLTGLDPDTAYYFVIRDSDGVSERYWFRTAPADCTSFAYVAGGDSRNNRGPRRDANTIVSKLRPLFVGFGGDFTDGDTDNQWQDWLDDWQSTVSSDGRMYPIVATRGNHDSNATVSRLFDTPSANNYYALSFGSLLRLYTLNSEITEGGTQGSWLASDLAANAGLQVYEAAQYHKPMRPHTSGKSEGNNEYGAWADTFYNNGVELVIESDSHMVKRTWPVRPSTGGGSDEGFVRDDNDGTVYEGEGTWGAPLRNDDDPKDWTRNLESFNQVKWIHVTQDEMRTHTIRTGNADNVDEVSDADPFTWPNNLDVWTPSNGAVVTIPARAGGPSCLAPFCGDGNLDAGEDCDPGIADDTIDCDYDGGNGPQACTLRECGDGYLNSVAEDCDTSLDTVDCDFDGGSGVEACTFRECGDSYTNTVAEECDGGAGDTMDCDYDAGNGPEACTLRECGDDYVNTVAEDCDTTSDTSTCDYDGGSGVEACTFRECGDFYLNSTVEGCDGGPGDTIDCNYDSGSGPFACTPVACGDGYHNTVAEECETDADTGACDFDGGSGSEACTLSMCQDGYLNLEAGEACDLGPYIPGSGCDASCQIECVATPGVVSALKAARRAPIDIQFYWGAEPASTAFRVYSVGDKFEVPTADAAGGGDLRCSSPDAVTLDCLFPGGVSDPDPSLYLQVVGVCEDSVTEGPH